MNNRLPSDFEPSPVWMWMAILPAKSPYKVTPEATALAKAKKLAGAIMDVVSGDLSSLTNFAWSDEDLLLSSLVQDFQPPARGFTIKYNDLGFIQYPSIDKIITEPIQLTFAETSGCMVEAYFDQWINDINRSSTSYSDRQATTVGKVYAPYGSSGFQPAGSLVTHRPLYLVRMRRDLALGTLDYAASLVSKTVLGLVAQIKTGMYELPIKVHHFPRVFPQKTVVSKLDHTDTNSMVTVSVTLERVPHFYIPDRDTGTPDMEYERTINAALGQMGRITSALGGLMDLAATAVKAVGTVGAISGMYSSSDAKKKLTDANSQPEQVG